MMAFDPVAFADLRRRRLLTLGRLQNAQTRYDQLKETVGQAKARLELAPSIKVALDELQRREHARSVGAFETLLTALLQDVFPEERAVHLDLNTVRGLPALNIQISKDNQHVLREDAKSGTGGGVTNGLSLGLRLISLVRSGHRPFLVLDEPDCWLETARVPAMAKLIQEAAQRIGVQVLMISHHPDHLLADIPHRLLLEKGADGLEAHWAPSSEMPTWAKDQPGLRAVYFENCYGHAHTFLPLAPGVTLLRGSNDLGKSSLVAALTAALTDLGNDSMIRHEADKATIRMDFGPDGILQFERWRKPKKTKTLVEPKVRYTYYGADQDLTAPNVKPLRESTHADELPEWVREISGIGPIEGLNVQLGEQKEPVFLLNQPAAVRAKALAIGTESAVVQAMMVQEKRELAEAKTRVKDGEKELEQLHRQIVELTPLTQHQVSFETLEGYAQIRQERQQWLSTARARVTRWRETQCLREALLPLKQTPMPAPPHFSPTAEWRRRAARWGDLLEQLQLWANWLEQTAPEPPVPARAAGMRQMAAQWRRLRQVHTSLHDWLAQPAPRTPTFTAIDRQLGRRWRRAQAQINLLRDMLARPAPQPLALPTVNQTALLALGTRWLQALDQEQAQRNVLQQAESEDQSAQEALDQFKQDLQARFPTCPLCDQPLQSHSFSHP